MGSTIIWLIAVISIGKFLSFVCCSQRIPQSNRMIDGLSKILPKYDHFIIDQWGVLHDGKKPYDSVHDCLELMRKMNKNLILLSNSSKRRISSYEGLKRVGISPQLFAGIVTSGELGWDIINERKSTVLASNLNMNQKLKVFVVGNGDDDKEYVSSCNCEFSDPSTASFILARGTFAIWNGKNNVSKFIDATDLMSAVQGSLRVCANYDLPMLVTNPDFYRPGSNSPMPGLIAQQYLQISPGAKIEYIGKPYPLVYEACQSLLQQGNNDSVDLSRVCCIGDSLEHDILGANVAGIDSVWIANGVHCSELGTAEGSSVQPDEQRMLSFLNKHANVKATYIVPTFQK
jgi:HAD superfamily hydrolase (TIGR01459 family)